MDVGVRSGNLLERRRKIEHPLRRLQIADVQDDAGGGWKLDGTARLGAISGTKELGIDAIHDDGHAVFANAERARLLRERTTDGNDARRAGERQAKKAAWTGKLGDHVHVAAMQLHDRRGPDKLGESHHSDPIGVRPRTENDVNPPAIPEHHGSKRRGIERGPKSVRHARHEERPRVPYLDAVDRLSWRNARDAAGARPAIEQTRAGKPRDRPKDLDVTQAREGRNLLTVEGRRRRLGGIGEDLRDDEDAEVGHAANIFAIVTISYPAPRSAPTIRGSASSVHCCPSCRRITSPGRTTEGEQRATSRSGSLVS